MAGRRPVVELQGAALLSPERSGGVNDAVALIAKDFDETVTIGYIENIAWRWPDP
jgi:hypothetical protein